MRVRYRTTNLYTLEWSSALPNGWKWSAMEAEMRSLSLGRKAVEGKVKLKIKINGKSYIVYGFAVENSDYIAVEAEYIKPAEND